MNSTIKLYHAALLVELLGDKAVPPSVLTQIKARGLYRKPRPDVILRSFQAGHLGLVNPSVLAYSNRKFEQFLVTKGIVLRPEERETLEILRTSFVDYVKALGDSMAAKVSVSTNNVNRRFNQLFQQREKRKILLDLERRKAVAAIAKDIAAIAPMQISALDRVLVTETNNAYQDGRAQEIIRKSRESDPRVFKIPRGDACPDCVGAYLEEDRKTPRVFRLSELLNNGTNVGKSRAARQPVIGSFHPWCACELFWLPPGFGFDPSGTMTYVGRRGVV